MPTSRWYDDGANVRNFGFALAEAGILEDVEEFQQFFTAPRGYTGTYNVWTEHEQPMNSEDENWAEFIEELSGDDDEEEEE